MELVPSVCPLDCPDRCSLSVEVEDGRVRRLGGTRLHAWTDGYICAKVRDFGELVHGPDRIRTPRIREGSTWREAAWDEAMSRVAERFRAVIAEHGAEAILPVWYGGSNGLLTGGGLDQRLWNRLGTSRCLRTLCAANTGAGTRMAYGAMPSVDLADAELASLVVVWGMNPSASGIHLLPPLKRVRERGGAVVVVDPRRTPLAASAALHLPVLPGADVPVALALAHVAIVEGLADEAWIGEHTTGWEAYRAAAMAWSPAKAGAEAGVAAADIERLARMYAEASPALIRCGWGLERTRNGSDAVRAALLLPAVFGKFGVRGGGWAMSTSAGYRADTAAWQGTSTARGINLSQLGRELEQRRDPPIRAVFVYNCNPMATVPDQGALARALAREDLFVVVHEQVWTDTCELADVVLPATTFLEHKELSRTYAGYALQWSEPVIPPVGDARSNHAVLQDLARRLGVADEVGEDALAAEILANIPSAPDFDTLRRDRVAALPRPVQFVDAFPSSGRVALSPPPTHRPPPCDADLPLILISPATPRAISSTLYAGERSAALELSPADAAARGIAEGDLVRASNRIGEVVAPARISPELRPGVASLPKGLWRRATRNGWTSNVLIPDHVDEHGGGACYNDARVEVAKA
jgi:anaerobic selenocysteine-containing dehydrogenase